MCDYCNEKYTYSMLSLNSFNINTKDKQQTKVDSYVNVDSY